MATIHTYSSIEQKRKGERLEKLLKLQMIHGQF